MRLLILSTIIAFHLTTSAQVQLDFETYKKYVLEFHPIIKQTKNKVEIGQNEFLKAKGQLDPKLFSEISGKQFDDKNYYQLTNSGLKIPTWLGIDLKAGYEQNNGMYISGEHQTPSSGLWYFGLEVPLGQGLLYDERRATIHQANVFKKMTLNEQELLINDLLLEAYSAYWTWFESYKKMIITTEGFDFALQRFNGVKQNAILGETPDIDTVEAKIQLDNRKFEQKQAEYDFQNARAMLSLYLWTANFVPLELEDSTIPQVDVKKQYSLENIELRLIDTNTTNLPMVLSTIYKLEQLKIEEKWKKEQLKPSISISYNPISQPVGNDPFQNFTVSNYKYGISASMPIFLRKERGALAQTKLKIENAKLDLVYKINELQQKEVFLKNEIYRLYEQFDIQQNQVLNAKLLRDSEQTRFEIGESSLFLVNSREIAYLQYKMKLAELEAKIKINEAKWLWIFSELD